MAGMEPITSADGTAIALGSVGAGPAVLLIGGAFNDRGTVAGLAAALDGFTAWSYDRRGRGGSGSLGPWPGPAGAVEQELADLEAVLAVVRPVATVGHSSGAGLVLEAAARGLPVGRVIAYEPPYKTGLDRFADRLAEATPADAVRLFLIEGVGLPAPAAEQAAAAPGMLALAPTLPYDAAITGSGGPPADRLAAITVPTVVQAGANSPEGMRSAAAATAAAVPGGTYVEVPGEDHAILQRPESFAAALRPLLSPA
jgi:pimeloyl-ACP methyl ester carboxylesterase